MATCLPFFFDDYDQLMDAANLCSFGWNSHRGERHTAHQVCKLRKWRLPLAVHDKPLSIETRSSVGGSLRERLSPLEILHDEDLSRSESRSETRSVSHGTFGRPFRLTFLFIDTSDQIVARLLNKSASLFAWCHSVCWLALT